MNNKFWTIGLLSIATIATISLPVRAQDSDTVTIIDATQDSIITGDRNSTDVNASQTNIENDRRGGGNVGVVIRSRQVTDLQGDDNDTNINVDQINLENGRRTPRNR